MSWENEPGAKTTNVKREGENAPTISYNIVENSGNQISLLACVLIDIALFTELILSKNNEVI